MKILYVITGLGLGGAEKVVSNLADKMYEAGHQVKIAYLTGEVKVRPLTEAIELIPLRLNHLGNVFSSCQKYQKLLAKYQPDVVHAHMIHANIFTRINRLFGYQVPKLICSAHSNNEGGKLRMLAYRLTHHLSDLNSNVSRDAVTQFEEKNAIPKNGMIAIYNGIDLKKFDKISVDNQDLKKIKEELSALSGTKIFLSIGRLEEAKDYFNLLNSILILKGHYHSNNQLKFLIAGSGSLKEQIKEKIANLGLEKEVFLLGRRDDIPLLLNISDYYVLSSKYEGLPTVVMEAMACACFCIATDCGGTKEIMEDTGILVPPEDSQKLAEAMLNVLNLPEEDIQANNIRARKQVEQLFSLDSSVETWLKHYAS